MNPEISVIIPFFNETENIDSLVLGLNDYFSTHSFNAEVIFVNDGSTDDSVKKLCNLKYSGYKAKIISFSKNYGSHAALRAGIKYASGTFITFTYADLQDPLELISGLYHRIQEGYDIVWAQRKSTRLPLTSRLFSRFYGYLMRTYAVPGYPDKGFDVVMFNNKITSELNNNIEKNSSLFLQILEMGFRQSSINYDKQQRKAGKSRWTLSKKIKLLIDSFVAFSYAPIRFVTIMGFSFFIIGSLWMLYVIWRKIFVGDVNSGWPALISILLMGFGITNISLGIIAEYLWRTLDASRKRPAFIIDEVIEVTNAV
jgi:glycosyltransferase involved in cell wall biosynthesis